MDGKLVTAPPLSENCRSVQGSKAGKPRTDPGADHPKITVGRYGCTRYSAGPCWRSMRRGHSPNKSGTAESCFYRLCLLEYEGQSLFSFISPYRGPCGHAALRSTFPVMRRAGCPHPAASSRHLPLMSLHALFVNLPVLSSILCHIRRLRIF